MSNGVASLTYKNGKILINDVSSHSKYIKIHFGKNVLSGSQTITDG
jgi:hypothetical protein